MKITIKSSGFLKSSEYLSDIESCFNLYTNDIKEIKLHFFELVTNLKGNQKIELIGYMKEGKACIVYITAIQQWENRKSELPDPSSIYIRLINTLKQLNKERIDKFPQLFIEAKNVHKYSKKLPV
jgi:hypothetical protein